MEKKKKRKKGVKRIMNIEQCFIITLYVITLGFVMKEVLPLPVLYYYLMIE